MKCCQMPKGILEKSWELLKKGTANPISGHLKICLLGTESPGCIASKYSPPCSYLNQINQFHWVNKPVTLKTFRVPLVRDQHCVCV